MKVPKQPPAYTASNTRFKLAARILCAFLVTVAYAQSSLAQVTWKGFPPGYPILQAGLNPTWTNIGSGGLPLVGNADWYHDPETNLVHIRFIFDFEDYDPTLAPTGVHFFGMKMFDGETPGLPPEPEMEILDTSGLPSGIGFNVIAGATVAQKGLIGPYPLMLPPLGHAQLLAGFYGTAEPTIVFVHDVVPPGGSGGMTLSYVNRDSPWTWRTDVASQLKGQISYLAK